MATFAYEAITVSSTAIGFTAGTLAKASSLYYRDVSKAMVTVETAPLRFTVDGATTPTDAIGHLLNPGDIVYIDGGDVAKFKAIRTTSTDSAIKVSYEV